MENKSYQESNIPSKEASKMVVCVPGLRKENGSDATRNLEVNPESKYANHCQRQPDNYPISFEHGA